MPGSFINKRDFQIPGERLINVLGGGHWSGYISPVPASLGLAAEGVKVTEYYIHHKVGADDLPRQLEVEVLPQIGWVDISALLIHYDFEVLEICRLEAGGGQPYAWAGRGIGGSLITIPWANLPSTDGGFLGGSGYQMVFNSPGGPLGNNINLLQSGCHYISLGVIPGTQGAGLLGEPYARIPFRFLACYMTGPGISYPLGTDRQLVQVNFRCIPYVPVDVSGNVSISGVALYDHFDQRNLSGG